MGVHAAASCLFPFMYRLPQYFGHVMVRFLCVYVRMYLFTCSVGRLLFENVGPYPCLTLLRQGQVKGECHARPYAGVKLKTCTSAPTPSGSGNVSSKLLSLCLWQPAARCLSDSLSNSQKVLEGMNMNEAH